MAREHCFTFPLANGLHARPAGLIQTEAARFRSETFWENLRTGARADAKSVLSLIGSDTRSGDACRLIVSGEDENRAVEALAGFIGHVLPAREAEAGAAETTPPGTAEAPRIIALEKSVFYAGVPAGPGIASGPILIHDPGSWDVTDARSSLVRSPEEERAAWLEAVRTVENDLSGTMDRTEGRTERAVIAAHLAMVRDRAFRAKVLELLSSGKTGAAAAVAEAGRAFSEMLDAGRSAYIRERLADMRDVTRALIRRISGAPPAEPELHLDAPAILVAHDLAPSEFLALGRGHLLGLALETTGLTSHVLIMARAAGIPAVTGLEGAVRGLRSGEKAVIDGRSGLLIPSPSRAVARYYEREMGIEAEGVRRRAAAAVLPGRTADGRMVRIAANIGGPDDLDPAWKNGAEGIGLFRTELLFAGRPTPPDEEEQYLVYRRLAESAGGRPVIIRTFDIGADKPAPFIPLPKEDNPQLGVRGVRLYERHEELIRTQLRAVLRAAAHGPLEVMFPMAGNLDEAEGMRRRLTEEAGRLAAAAIPHRASVALGMMVEVPAAAILVDKLAGQVDFFSVGTNDLLQYFFAADRGNPAVRGLNQPTHPAFIRLLGTITAAARAAHRPVGLCGEMAGLPRFLPLLVGLGFDELSMTPAAVPVIKAGLAVLDSEACRGLAETAAGLSSRREVEDGMERFSGTRTEAPLAEPALVGLASRAASKAEALQELAAMMEGAGRTADRRALERALWSREDTFSTGIGFGVAIPHCKSEAVGAAAAAFLRFAEPMDWPSSDGRPVEMAVMLVIPAKGGAADHLKLLASLSRRLVHAEFREMLRAATDPKSVVRLIIEAAEG